MSNDVKHFWKLRKGTRDVFDCPQCGMWTANCPLYLNDVCPAKERRKRERRKHPVTETRPHQ
jgi:hypothetical protein